MATIDETGRLMQQAVSVESRQAVSFPGERHAGESPHRDLLLSLLPPWTVREVVRYTMAGNAEAMAWLARLDKVTAVRESAGEQWR